MDVSDTFRRCVGSCGERFVDDSDELKCVDKCVDGMFRDEVKASEN